ncbi:MAG: (2Fe-2S)-binding protein [Leptospirales bacterium]|nr:(2Fe-2S)-binding protein [Leptospirales bacterium]
MQSSKTASSDVICRCSGLIKSELHELVQKRFSLERITERTGATHGCSTCANELRREYGEARLVIDCERKGQYRLL